ncbi:MAG: adenylate/guanylate cyclase domain-containing protein, partial [Pseudonocardiaceae bacterium]
MSIRLGVGVLAAAAGAVLCSRLRMPAPSAPLPDRILTTVMFTDIVGSTERAAALGDAHWRELAASHDKLVRAEVERYRGREVKAMGDGFLATFDGPARGIRCARAIVDSLRPLGIKVRVGLHTGECELVGNDLGGIAVNIGARISALAGAHEVLVSSIVKDLVLGSGVTFVDRGGHELRGVPGEWRLFGVDAIDPPAGSRPGADPEGRRPADQLFGDGQIVPLGTTEHVGVAKKPAPPSVIGRAAAA